MNLCTMVANITNIMDFYKIAPWEGGFRVFALIFSSPEPKVRYKYGNGPASVPAVHTFKVVYL